MSYETSAFYKNTPDLQFNKDYWLNNHLPLAHKTFTPYGLKGFRVIEFEPSLNGDEPLYKVGVTMVWDNAESFKRAFGSEEAKAILADLVNYSNAPPKLIAGAILKTYGLDGGK